MITIHITLVTLMNFDIEVLRKSLLFKNWSSNRIKSLKGINHCNVPTPFHV